MANFELDSPVFDGDMAMLFSSLGHYSFTGSAVPPEGPQTDADLLKYCTQTYLSEDDLK